MNKIHEILKDYNTQVHNLSLELCMENDLDKLEQTMQEIKILKNRMRILNQTLDIIFEYDYINE